MSKKGIERAATGVPYDSAKSVVFSASDGRRDLPELLQQSLYLYEVFAFHRHKRPVGALVPIEALRMIASGKGDEIDPDTRRAIEANIQRVLEQLEEVAER